MRDDSLLSGPRHDLGGPGQGQPILGGGSPRKALKALRISARMANTFRLSSLYLFLTFFSSSVSRPTFTRSLQAGNLSSTDLHMILRVMMALNCRYRRMVLRVSRLRSFTSSNAATIHTAQNEIGSTFFYTSTQSKFNSGNVPQRTILHTIGKAIFNFE